MSSDTPRREFNSIAITGVRGALSHRPELPNSWRVSATATAGTGNFHQCEDGAPPHPERLVIKTDPTQIDSFATPDSKKEGTLRNRFQIQTRLAPSGSKHLELTS